MPSTLNLKRNSRVFFTTNVAAGTGVVATTGFTTSNTQELTILDGFSFSQTVAAAAISVNEAGSTPTRGQRSFNTALNPVDFSFSTYIRPNLNGSIVSADEYVLWNALFSDRDGSTGNSSLTGATSTACSATGILTVIGTGMAVQAANSVFIVRGATGAFANQLNSAIQVITSSTTTLTAQYLTAPTTAAAASVVIGTVTAATVLSTAAWNANTAVAADTVIGTTAYSEVTTARSNINQLLPFGLIMTVDGVSYTIDNCAMDQASVDFGLDGIAMVAWTGKGTKLSILTTNVAYSAVANPVMTGGLTGTATGKSATATTRFITNKLSTALITANIGGGGLPYTLALTGGSIQIANNLTYLTPSNLGVLNIPIGYFTASRSITGSINAYLRTGGGTTKNTGDLLNQILVDSTTNGVTELKYQLAISVGGGSNATRVDLLVNGASLQVPTIDAGQDIISTVISFTAQGTDNVIGTAGTSYDLSNTNDLRLRYFSN